LISKYRKKGAPKKPVSAPIGISRFVLKIIGTEQLRIFRKTRKIPPIKKLRVRLCLNLKKIFEPIKYGIIIPTNGIIPLCDTIKLVPTELTRKKIFLNFPAFILIRLVSLSAIFKRSNSL